MKEWHDSPTPTTQTPGVDLCKNLNPEQKNTKEN